MTAWTHWNSSGDSICMTLPERNWIIRPGGQPKPGATARLVGSLGQVFPELKNMTEKDLERELRRMRR